jgi:hypothetical protein
LFPSVKTVEFEKSSFFPKPIDKSFDGEYNVWQQIHKGGAAMLTSGYGYFYYLIMSCPSFVNYEK